MIYEFALLMLGIYLGQEYNVIPSVRLVVLKACEYVQVDQQQKPNQNSTAVTLYTQIVTFFDTVVKRTFGHPHDE
jgi:hypothetical protein